MSNHLKSLLALAFIAFVLSFLTFRTVKAQVWNQVSVPTSKNLNVIDFPSANIGYIGGQDSVLLKTTDGGLTWSQINFSGLTFFPGGEHIVGMQFLDNDRGFVTIGPYGGLFYTSDGGLTWSQEQTAGSQCYYDGLFFFSDTSGFVGGSGCFMGELIEKKSGGTYQGTAAPNGMSAMEMITAIDFHSQQYGLASSSGNRIYRTTDGGMTWDSVHSTMPSGSIVEDILIVNDTLAYAGYTMNGSGFSLLMSLDSGKTWQWENNGATFFYPDFLCLHQSGNGTVWTGGRPQFGPPNGIIFTQMQNGWWNYWPLDQAIHGISSYNDSIVFAVGDSGYVVTNMDSSILNTVDPTVQAEFVLYPNPSSGIVRLEMLESPTDPWKVRIFSATGSVLFEDRLEMNAMELDLQELPDGMYWVVLENGVSRISKALVLR